MSLRRVPRTVAVVFLSFLSTAAVVPASAGQAAQAPPRGPAGRAAPADAQQMVPRTVQVVPSEIDARQTAERLHQILEQHPPSLREVFRLDPTLLDNPDYLAPYPQLAAFLAQHPEIARNPSFFVGDADRRGWERNDPRVEAVRVWSNAMEALAVLGGMLIFVLTLAWLVRTALDYRRWSRLSKVQVDVHTKLLDRFTSNEDLLAYMQTPAGRRFLESAPIAVDAAPRAVGAPLSRILWSVQAGAVMACLGFGLLFVSRRVIEEASQPLFALGVVGVAIGIGFVLSAVVSYLLSRRLNLLPIADTPARGDTAELRS